MWINNWFFKDRESCFFAGPVPQEPLTISGKLLLFKQFPARLVAQALWLVRHEPWR